MINKISYGRFSYEDRSGRNVQRRQTLGNKLIVNYVLSSQLTVNNCAPPYLGTSTSPVDIVELLLCSSFSLLDKFLFLSDTCSQFEINTMVPSGSASHSALMLSLAT